MKGLRAFQLRDLSQHSSGFRLKRAARGVKILLGEFSCLVFEVQVAQILVDHFLALAQIDHAGLLRRGLHLIARKKDIREQSTSQRDACEGDHHSSVSLRACSRKLESIGAIDGVAAARILPQRLIKKIASDNPTARAK